MHTRVWSIESSVSMAPKQVKKYEKVLMCRNSKMPPAPDFNFGNWKLTFMDIEKHMKSGSGKLSSVRKTSFFFLLKFQAILLYSVRHTNSPFPLNIGYNIMIMGFVEVHRVYKAEIIFIFHATCYWQLLLLLLRFRNMEY